MKLIKYTFRTPLVGSIDCQELQIDILERVTLTSEQMCRLYDEGEELLLFLTHHEEDLTAHVPEEFASIILRAHFGDFAVLGGRMWLKTYIWTQQELTESQIDKIEEWIRGQMADGWGEELEEQEWKVSRVQRPTLYFDEDSLEFEEDYENCDVYYYVHPWNSETFAVYLDDCEEVEESPNFDVIASIHVPYHNLEVVKCADTFALKTFLNGYGRPSMLINIELHRPSKESVTYLVRDLDAPTGIEILNKWAYATGGICHIHDMGSDDPVMTRTTIVNAILELLK